MILFIAPNPHKVKQREGFLQRVYAIDQLFPDQKKLYFDDLAEPEQQSEAITQADVIYVHSVYNANKILRLYPYFADKIITDMHGVVPEEAVLAQDFETEAVMAETEKQVFKFGKYFIAVTDAMVSHFREKYKLSASATWLVLPIADPLGKRVPARPSKPTDVVIYAGGGQSWQKVDKMVDAINTVRERYKYLILTHNLEAFSGIDDDLKPAVTVKTVPSAEITKYYKQATFGFALRDNHVVNRVACPTKLIEYLANGVIPIVLYEGIGDFKAMGYTYILLEDFLHKTWPPKKIQAAIAENYKVYDKYRQRIGQGEKLLQELCAKISNNRPSKEDIPGKLLQNEIEIQNLRNTILKYEFQIQTYKIKIGEYAKAVEYYQERERQFAAELKRRAGLLRRIKHKVYKKLKRP